MVDKFNITDMIKGWFIGDFEPTLYQTSDVEVGVKHYKAGEFEQKHYHKIATEFTVIIIGEIEMNGEKFYENEIVKINPGISTDFKAITDVTTVVVKIPGASNDKYISK
jgi:mannose-6-phosphate isomerase-like protein (cupin superfamily)